MLRDDPTALEVYRVTSEGIVRLERVLATSDPKRVKSERNRMARKLLEIQSREDELFFQRLMGAGLCASLRRAVGDLSRSQTG